MNFLSKICIVRQAIYRTGKTNIAMCFQQHYTFDRKYLQFSKTIFISKNATFCKLTFHKCFPFQLLDIVKNFAKYSLLGIDKSFDLHKT